MRLVLLSMYKIRTSVCYSYNLDFYSIWVSCLLWIIRFYIYIIWLIGLEVLILHTLEPNFTFVLHCYNSMKLHADVTKIKFFTVQTMIAELPSRFLTWFIWFMITFLYSFFYWVWYILIQSIINGISFSLSRLNQWTSLEACSS